MMKRVIIVGGGYAGANLARALDKVAEVCVVEARDHFVHNVAAIRSVVDPSLLGQIVIPYDRLLRRGRVRQGLVASAFDGGVTLANGETIEGDVVIVATGSSYARPFKPAWHFAQAFADSVKDAHAGLLETDRVAIVGGGAVGVELAGEIAVAYPRKRVTLISGAPTLMSGYPEKLARSLEAQLRTKGVALHLGTRVETLESTECPYLGALSGMPDTLGEQLIFPALGARPVSAVFKQMPGARFNPQGRVKVDAWLRPARAQRVFAFGDAAATGDPMTIVAITRQVPWLVKVVAAMLAGESVESLPTYVPWSSRGILVPLGPRDGASVLPVTRNGVLVGKCPTALIKGRDLFIPRYRKEFGYSGQFA
jgi:NADH dehydrogenase FAD-containing subunit